YERRWIEADDGEPEQRRAPGHREPYRRHGANLEHASTTLEKEAGEQGARRVGAEEQGIERARIAVPEILCEARHLSLVAVADEEGSSARERDHRREHRDGTHGGDTLEDVGNAAHGARRHTRRIAEMPSVRRRDQPHEER